MLKFEGGIRCATSSDETEKHLGGNVLEGDPWTFAPSVWTYLVQRFAIRSVLDLGSGIGYSSRFFANLGCQVLAVDGFDYNVQNAVHPTVQIDLTRMPVSTRVDLVHCQEVVEHIEERFLENVLASLCTGRFIVMTNALPGQDGYHHVNCQPTSYWIEHLTRRGCNHLEEESRRVRKLAAGDGAVHLANSASVFINTARLRDC
jgi:SAM-dependent methyltransferase